MFRRFSIFFCTFVVLPLAAQFVSVPPQDRLQLAIQLSKRGMHVEALREYEAIRSAKSVPHDEVLFRLGDTYRLLKRPQEALDCYGELIRSTPESRYADVARLNRAMLREGGERVKERWRRRRLRTARRRQSVLQRCATLAISRGKPRTRRVPWPTTGELLRSRPLTRYRASRA